MTPVSMTVVTKTAVCQTPVLQTSTVSKRVVKDYLYTLGVHSQALPEFDSC